MTSPWMDGALGMAAADALGRFLSRMPASLREEALRSLRREMEGCLTEAPIGGAPVDAMMLRAELGLALASSGPVEWVG